MEANNEYNFSLFKPASKYGRKNSTIVITMIAIWFVAIFGFQFLLLVLEKPTPEKALLTFESVWDNVKAEKATVLEKQDFIKSLIMVEGKSVLKKEKKVILDNAITWASYGMVSDSEKIALSQNLQTLKSTREKLGTAKDEEYIKLQTELSNSKASILSLLGPKINIGVNSLEASILPYCLNTEAKVLSKEDQEALPKIMTLYMTHNQSVLTDTIFLGFPFHYFYTSEFLLFLFVALCLTYSKMIDRLQKKFSIDEN